MRYGRAIAVAMLLPLGSCGGDGARGVAVVPGGATPAPTPAPAPTPTPTPTPAASYDQAYNLAQDRTFALIGAELTAVGDFSPGTSGYTFRSIAATLQDALVSPTLAYLAANQQAALNLNNSTPALMFDRSEVNGQPTATILSYITPTGFLAYFAPTPTVGGAPVALRYTIGVVQNDQIRNAANGLDVVERRYVSGTPTLPQDVPGSGNAAYTVLLTSYVQTGSGANTFNGDGATLSIDYATGAVTGTITATSTASGQPVTNISLTFAGRLGSGSSGRFSGTVTGNNAVAGNFAGRLFGPGGKEVGLSFALTRGEDRIVGSAFGLAR